MLLLCNRYVYIPHRGHHHRRLRLKWWSVLSVNARELRFEVRLHHREHLLNSEAHASIEEPLRGGVFRRAIQRLEGLRAGKEERERERESARRRTQKR